MGLRITLLGKGAWGSTLGRLWSLQGHDVTAWSRRDGPLQPTLLLDSSLVVSAVSMAGVESLAQALAGHWPPGVPLLSCSKGIDLQRLCSASQIWQRHHPETRMAVLSGPNLPANWIGVCLRPAWSPVTMSPWPSTCRRHS